MNKGFMGNHRAIIGQKLWKCCRELLHHELSASRSHGNISALLCWNWNVRVSARWLPTINLAPRVRPCEYVGRYADGDASGCRASGAS